MKIQQDRDCLNVRHDKTRLSFLQKAYFGHLFSPLQIVLPDAWDNCFARLSDGLTDRL